MGVHGAFVFRLLDKALNQSPPGNMREVLAIQTPGHLVNEPVQAMAG